MKNLQTAFIVTIVLFFSVAIHAQSKFEKTLTGKWTARCAPAEMSNGSITVCDLCPISASKDGTQIQMKSFEMTFEKDNLTLVRNNVTTTVNYTDSKEPDAFTFTFDGKTYHFKIFTDVPNLILHDSNGTVLVLEKAK